MLPIAGLIIGFLISFFITSRTFNIDLNSKEKEAKNLLKKHEKQAEDLLKEAKEKGKENAQKLEESNKRLESKLERFEEVLKLKENTFSRQQKRIDTFTSRIETEEHTIKELEESKDKFHQQLTEKISKKSGIKIEQATKDFFNKFNADLESYKEEKITKETKRFEYDEEKIAAEAIVDAIQRFDDTSSVEKKSFNIIVPRDIAKGRIIGRDGMNVMHLEEKLGVDVVFNDLPKTISIACFDLVNRNIARLTIKKLLPLRKITPEIIDKKIEQSTKEIESDLLKTGEWAARRIDLEKEKWNPELLKIMGRLKYRTSYGQNILLHSLEVAHMARIMAAKIGADERTAFIGGFFHDVGKAIDHDREEPHDYLSKEIMENHGFTWEETHAAWTHHDAIPMETAEAYIVKGADAISATRPGARQESLEKYLERIKKLEEIAMSFNGVKKTYAISAGREIRMFVDPKKVKDDDLIELAENAAGTIEDELTYPGQVKVNVIRRSRFVDSTK